MRPESPDPHRQRNKRLRPVMSRDHRHLLPGELQLAVLSSPRPCLPLRSITAVYLLRILLHCIWLKDSLQAVTAEAVRVQAVRVQAVTAQAVRVQAVTAQAVRAQAGTVGTVGMVGMAGMAGMAGTAGTAGTAEAVTAGAGQGNRPFVFNRPFVQETKVMAATGRVIPIVWNLKREIPCVCPSL
jgi:hypothetical protein